MKKKNFAKMLQNKNYSYLCSVELKTKRMEEKKDNKKTVEDFIRENPTIVETLRDAAKVCEAHSHSFIGGALRRYADRLREIEDGMEVLWKG